MTGEPLDSDPVRSRGPAAVVQLVAFVGGGFLGPVWHLTHHRNDHTHEADGSTTALGQGDAEEPDHHHSHEAEEPAEEQAAPSDGRHEATPLPAPLDHGHASIAHFGLALLGAPALLAVPAPQPGEWVVVARSTAALRLFHPSFPRPRPPPPSRPA